MEASGAETKTEGGAECLLIHELREGFLAGVPLLTRRKIKIWMRTELFVLAAAAWIEPGTWRRNQQLQIE
jgi:hypothetical protein